MYVLKRYTQFRDEVESVQKLSSRHNCTWRDDVDVKIPHAAKKRRLNKNISPKDENKISICIDTLSANKYNPLLYINDGRKSFYREEKDDRNRINCKFNSILLNGWPAILIKTTKYSTFTIITKYTKHFSI